VDTKFHKNRAFPYTTSPIFPFFILFEGFGSLGEDVTTFKEIIDNQCICKYAIWPKLVVSNFIFTGDSHLNPNPLIISGEFEAL